MTPPASAAIFEVESLRIERAGRSILDIDGFSLSEPSLTVIEGGRGSGKTTFAAALIGSIPASGTVTLAGAVLGGEPSRRVAHGLAGVVRDGARVSGCTVGEALLLAARRRSRANEALGRFELLAARRGVAAQLLSGGEQQLLQVACAWCTEPRVLLLDSPTVGLAADAAAAVAQLTQDEVTRGAVVIWLEQDRRDGPVPARWRLLKGTLSAVTASVSAGSAAASRQGPGGASSP